MCPPLPRPFVCASARNAAPWGAPASAAARASSLVEAVTARTESGRPTAAPSASRARLDGAFAERSLKA